MCAFLNEVPLQRLAYNKNKEKRTTYVLKKS